MKFRLMLVFIAVIILVLAGCSKDSATSNSKTPYFQSGVQIAPIIVTGYNAVASITVIDPKENQVQARFDWGDGTITDYSPLVESGTPITVQHIYTQPGFYSVKAYARNSANVQTGVWSAPKVVQVLNPGEPYVQEIIQSKTEMVVGNQIVVQVLPEEVNGFTVQVRINWGDGMISAWSDATVPSYWHNFTHNYNQTGTYQIKAQVKSSVDSLSVWYDADSPLVVYNVPPTNDLILIPAGSFMMGYTGENFLLNETPVDTVYVDAFYMSKFEISQTEWMNVMGTNPSNFGTTGELYAPVENVSWYDCIEYCNKRSILEGLTPTYSINDGQGNPITDPSQWPANWKPIYPDTTTYVINCDFTANGYRLPEESEWEYAAKAGTDNMYSGTNDPDELNDYAWYGGFPYHSHIVGLKQPNEWGLYDMTGNVWEWCWNSYRYYPGNTALLSAANRSLKIVRGGSWSSNRNISRVSYRNTIVPSMRSFIFGLRVVRTAN